MTYNVFGGTLNLAQSINHSLLLSCFSCVFLSVFFHSSILVIYYVKQNITAET